MARVAVVTGSNKGIGFEVVRQLCQKNPSWITYLTARDVSRGEAAKKELESSGIKPKFHQLDVESVDSIKTFANFLKKEHGGLDVLVNNAGMAMPADSPIPFAEQAVIINKTNYFGWLNVCNELFPLLRDHARVVNVASRGGHLLYGKISDEKKNALRDCQSVEDVTKLLNSFISSAQKGTHIADGWSDVPMYNVDISPYCMSKLGVAVASNQQQKAIDQDGSRKDIVINACCPGYVNTDLNAHQGHLTPAEGADTLVYLAMLPENCKEPRGTFVNERVVNDVFTGSLDMNSLLGPSDK